MFENEGDRNQENSIREHTYVLPYGKTCSLKITFPQKVSSPQPVNEGGNECKNILPGIWRSHIWKMAWKHYDRLSVKN